MNKIKVLHILPSNKFSGAENVVCQIIAMFNASESYEMFYCCPEGPIRKVLYEKKINFIPLTRFSKSNIKQILCEYKPTIIHAHDMLASFLVAQVCGRTPYISHIHVNNFYHLNGKFKSIIYFFVALRANHILWVSKSAFNAYCFHSFFQGKSTILYNVIDRNSIIEKMNTDTKVYPYDIVYVGRLSEQKNPLRLIHVIEIIIEKIPDVRVAIIGQGSMEGEMKKQVNELGLEKNIEFLGFQNNPYKMMSDAKVMIMTSLWEGTPMCALEALGLGLPIVSTPTDGLCELVIDGQTGFLSNEDEILAEKCYKIITNPELQQRLSVATLSRAIELLDVNAYKQKLSKIYEHALK